MKDNGTLVRTKLTKQEYAEIKVLALRKGIPASQFVAEHLRKLLPKAKA